MATRSLAVSGEPEKDQGGAYEPVSQPQPERLGLGKRGALGAGAAGLLLLLMAVVVLSQTRARMALRGSFEEAGVHVLLRRDGTHGDSDRRGLGTNSNAVDNSSGSASGNSSADDSDSGPNGSSASRDAARRPSKGDRFRMHLVDGFSQGCCSWNDRCDSSQAFCNKDNASCTKCGGEWRAEAGPANFGGSPHAWCAEGRMDSWRVPAVPEYMPAAASPSSLKVLTYNLMWWRVYGKWGGLSGSEGHLVRDTGPYDLLGLQECDNPWQLLGEGGVLQDYAVIGGKGDNTLAVCAAFRKAAWKELDRGNAFVAEDGAGKYNYFGKRVALWLRLQHRATNETVLFVVHHGPLPLSSGGLCGGHATGFNLLRLVAERSRQGDAVVLLGDFNAASSSPTVQTVASQLARVYSGWRFGGIDHVFTNLGSHRVLASHNLGTGGSDHDALSVTLQLGRAAPGSAEASS